MEDRIKNTLFFSIGVLALVFVFTSAGFAQRYHLTYTGSHFNGDTADNFWKSIDSIGNSGSGLASFHAPVVFPDSANGKQVTRLSCTVGDNSVSGFVQVQLWKVDRWTGLSTNVGYVTTPNGFAANSVVFLNRPKSQMMARGIDSNRWAWVLVVFFSEGNTNLWLSHVTIRYE